MSLPNEKQLELENWCDEDEPSEALNRLICIIEELKLFSIQPKWERLGPGKSSPSPTDRSVYSRNSHSASAEMSANQQDDLRSRQSASRASMRSGLSQRQSAKVRFTRVCREVIVASPGGFISSLARHIF